MKSKIDINEPTPIYDADIYEIDEKQFIKVQLYEKRGKKFYTVVFIKDNEEKFLGKFEQDNCFIKVLYNNNRILIFTEEFNQNDKKMDIDEVLALYNIDDDTFYSCSQKDALKLFNSELNLTYLKHKQKLLIRTDIEKKKRINT